MAGGRDLAAHWDEVYAQGEATCSPPVQPNGVGVGQGRDLMPGVKEISRERWILASVPATYWPEPTAAMSSRMRAGGRCCS